MEHKNWWFVDVSLYLVGGTFRLQPLVLRGVKVGFDCWDWLVSSHRGTWPLGGLDMVQETGSFAVF